MFRGRIELTDKLCSECGTRNGFHTQSCVTKGKGKSEEVPLKMNTNPPKLRASMHDGFFVVELKHPLQKNKRTIVQVVSNVFCDTHYFDKRTVTDGLENCYKVLGEIHLEAMTVERTTNEFIKGEGSQC